MTTTELTPNFRHANRCQGVQVEGIYECIETTTAKVWVLRFWRVITIRDWKVGDDCTYTGEWQKVRGNQKRDIGALKIHRRSAPTLDSPLPVARGDYQTLVRVNRISGRYPDLTSKYEIAIRGSDGRLYVRSGGQWWRLSNGESGWRSINVRIDDPALDRELDAKEKGVPE